MRSGSRSERSSPLRGAVDGEVGAQRRRPALQVPQALTLPPGPVQVEAGPIVVDLEDGHPVLGAQGDPAGGGLCMAPDVTIESDSYLDLLTRRLMNGFMSEL